MNEGRGTEQLYVSPVVALKQQHIQHTLNWDVEAGGRRRLGRTTITRIQFDLRKYLERPGAVSENYQKQYKEGAPHGTFLFSPRYAREQLLAVMIINKNKKFENMRTPRGATAWLVSPEGPTWAGAPMTLQSELFYRVKA